MGGMEIELTEEEMAAIERWGLLPARLPPPHPTPAWLRRARDMGVGLACQLGAGVRGQGRRAGDRAAWVWQRRPAALHTTSESAFHHPLLQAGGSGL